MTNQAPSRNITIQSKDAGRWQRPLPWVLLAFVGLHLCAVIVLRNAPPVVHTIQGLVFVVGFAGFIVVAVIVGVKSRQHFHLVFTFHWTEPKEVALALTRLWYKEKGIVASLWPGVCVGLVYSCLMALNWLLAWGNSKLDPSKYALPLPWALVVILLPGLGLAALPHLVNFLSALFNSRTIGFDNEWMGWLQGQPGKALWRYEQIATVRFRSLRVGEREFPLLVVSPREGREAAFGLSDEVDLRQIADLLAAKGVTRVYGDRK